MAFSNVDVVLNNKNEELAKELNEFVKGVKIDVFIDDEGLMCSKKFPECKTLLGPTSINDLRSVAKRISNGLSKMANVFAFIPIISSFYVIFVLAYHLLRPQIHSDFILNDDKKTYNVIGLEYIPIFINKHLLDKLTHDELVSISLLHSLKVASLEVS